MLSKLDPYAAHHDSSRKWQPTASVSPLFQTLSAGDMTFDSYDMRMPFDPGKASVSGTPLPTASVSKDERALDLPATLRSPIHLRKK